jgi:hypothetical protein
MTDGAPNGQRCPEADLARTRGSIEGAGKRSFVHDQDAETHKSKSTGLKPQKLWCLLLAQRNADGKLFGGGGLKKACDQLYFIETIEGSENARWLSIDASRYTARADVGGTTDPVFILEKKTGPYIHEKGVL